MHTFSVSNDDSRRYILIFNSAARMQAGLSAVLTARIIFHLRLTAATHSSGIVTTEVYKLSRVIPRESALVFKSQASEMESPSQLMP